jgi:PAS domain S-box-containing protein
MDELIIHALGASREIVEKLYKESPVVFAVSTLDDIYTPLYVSSNIHSVLQLDEKTEIGKEKSLYDLVFVDDRSLYSQGIKKFVDDNNITNYVFPYYRITDSRNRLIWVSDEKTKIYDKTGNLLAVKTKLQNVNDKIKFEKSNAIIEEITQAIIKINKFTDLFHFVEKIFNEVIDVDNYYIARIENDEYLNFILFFDQHDKSPGKRKFKKGITEYLIKKGESLLFTGDDITELNKRGEIDIIGSVPEYWAGFPIKIKNKIIGVLAVQRYDNYPFSDSEIELMSVFAGELSYATTFIQQRKELFRGKEALKKSNKIFDTLYRISNVAGNTNNDINKVFETVIAELRNVFPESLWIRIKLPDIEFNTENFINTKRIYSVKINTPDRTNCFIEIGQAENIEVKFMFDESDYKLLNETVDRIEDYFYRKNAVKVLEESELKFRSIIHFASDAIIIIDEKGIVADSNQSVENTFGFERKEIKGKNIEILIPSEENRKSIFEIFNEQMNNKSSSQVELLCKKKDDTIFPAELSFGSWVVGMKRSYALFIRDISEKIRVENQLALSRKMEAIGELAAGIAHEINTPMQFISDNTNFIKESFESFSEYLTELNLKLLEDNKITIEELKEFTKQKEEALDMNFLMEEIPEAIGQTIEGIERVTKIVKTMKEFSHPSSKEKVLTDLNKNINDTVIITKNEWKYVADVELNLDDNLPLVKCLPDEINQVLLNITVNAAQAIEEKVGKNPETKGKIVYSTFVEDNFVVIIIEDSGIGIPKENLQKIFGPFFTTKEVGRGTGQGLAIAMDIIVNKHGGVLDVESEPNKGSKFIIKLPIEERG